ncbi:MAG: nuclease-related domain-containing protein, partial [Rheinheimera sp.]|nr:nuclease-related domain-containing protein [Rheinheimera sp.]
RGHIDGSEAAANWSRHYFGQHKLLMNPLHQNFKNVEAVKALLQLQGSDTAAYVHSIIAFSRVATLSSGTPANVTYVDKVAAYLKQFTTPVLTDEQLNRFSAVLSQASAEQ